MHACTGRTPGTSDLFKRQTVNLSSSCQTSQTIFLINRGEICFFPCDRTSDDSGFLARAHTCQPLSLAFTLHGVLRRAEGRCNVVAGPYDCPPWANIYHTTLSTTNPSSSHTKWYIYDIYVELDEAVLEITDPYWVINRITPLIPNIVTDSFC